MINIQEDSDRYQEGSNGQCGNRCTHNIGSDRSVHTWGGVNRRKLGFAIDQRTFEVTIDLNAQEGGDSDRQ